MLAAHFFCNYDCGRWGLLFFDKSFWAPGLGLEEVDQRETSFPPIHRVGIKSRWYWSWFACIWQSREASRVQRQWLTLVNLSRRAIVCSYIFQMDVWSKWRSISALGTAKTIDAHSNDCMLQWDPMRCGCRVEKCPKPFIRANFLRSKVEARLRPEKPNRKNTHSALSCDILRWFWSFDKSEDNL